MNPLLARLQPYPFERLRSLLAGKAPDRVLQPIDLSIGEPKHPTPQFIKDALVAGLDGLATYPRTAGIPELRQAISAWIARRYGIAAPDPEAEVLPINGSREALFSFAQTVLAPGGRVLCPNPFYQIYEGAALLAGCEPAYATDLLDADWTGAGLAYVCSPSNPTGRILALEDWKRVFAVADRHGTIVASDECYSELYYERPSVGALEAARKLGRGYERLVVFSSLSKRSNVPGMRSGFVAGDRALLKAFLLYRTYHGSAMSVAVQKASIAAWEDEEHVEGNRRLYAEKFAAVLPRLRPPLQADMPDGAFYLWMRTPTADTAFARDLYHQYNVLVLPGSYLARDAGGANPGRNRVRVALVAPLAECVEGIDRIMRFAQDL